jgi:hypothetical protein
MRILVHATNEIGNRRSRVYDACVQGSVCQRRGVHAVRGEELDAFGFEDVRTSLSGIQRRQGEQCLSSSVAALGTGNQVVLVELPGLAEKNDGEATYKHAIAIENHGNVGTGRLLRLEMLASWLPFLPQYCRI